MIQRFLHLKLSRQVFNSIIKKKDDHIFLIVNILFPILLGGIIYYLLCPNVVFVKRIDTITNLNIHFIVQFDSHPILKFIRYYMLDMLWAYSLTISLAYLLRKEATILFILILFSFFIESLQYINFAMGSFDLFDVFFEIITGIIAIFIFKRRIML